MFNLSHNVNFLSLTNLRYELILSCSKKQQYKLAKYCDDCLGDMLLREPLPNYPVSDYLF